VKEGRDPTWYVHTRVFQYICFDKESFIDYQPFSSSEIMFLGDNSMHKIYGQGVVIVKLLNGIENKYLKFYMFLDFKKKCFQQFFLIK
jgi:hypothetical protein